MSEQIESRVAFDELLDTLREARDRYAGEEWGITAPDDVAGALRALAHLLEGGLVGHFEDDPAAPVFRQIVTSTRKSMGDNADAIYFDTADLAAVRATACAAASPARCTCRSRSRRARHDGGFPDRDGGVLNDTRLRRRRRRQLRDLPRRRTPRPQLDRARPRRGRGSRPGTTGKRNARPRSRRCPDVALDIEVLDELPPPPRRRATRRSRPGCRRVTNYVRSRTARTDQAGRGRPARVRVARAERVPAAGAARRPRARRVRRGVQHGAVRARARRSARDDRPLARVPLRQRVAVEPAPADVRLRAPAGVAQPGADDARARRHASAS